MPCQYCNHLATPHLIKTQKGLAWVIEKTHTAIVDGTLTELSIDSPCTVKMVYENDCASDFLDMRFRCKHCQQHFTLSCETYEAEAGQEMGKWEIEKISENFGST